MQRAAPRAPRAQARASPPARRARLRHPCVSRSVGARAASEAGAGGGCGDADGGLASLRAWLGSCGGSVDARLAVGVCDLGGVNVRGVLCTQPVAEGELLMRVPLGCVLLEGREGDERPPFAGAPFALRFAGRLLELRDEARAAEGAGTLQTLQNQTTWAALLPSAGETPLSGAIMEAGPCRSGYAPAAGALEEVRAMAAEAAAASQTHPDREDWAWALGMVLSRALRMKGKRMMIPAVDLLNHGGTQRNIQVGLAVPQWGAAADGAGDIVVVAGRDLTAGEQVLFSYGDTRSNDFFFRYFGFCIGGHQYETFRLFADIGEALEWHTSTFRVDGESAAGTDGRRRAAAAAAASSVGQFGSGELGQPHPRMPMATIDGSGELEMVGGSYRLHKDTLGSDTDVTPLAPELCVRADGRADARLLAAFEALGAVDAREALAVACDGAAAQLRGAAGRGRVGSDDLERQFHEEKLRCLSDVARVCRIEAAVRH